METSGYPDGISGKEQCSETVASKAAGQTGHIVPSWVCWTTGVLKLLLLGCLWQALLTDSVWICHNISMSALGPSPFFILLPTIDSGLSKHRADSLESSPFLEPLPATPAFPGPAVLMGWGPLLSTYIHLFGVGMSERELLRPSCYPDSSCPVAVLLPLHATF